jgi:hypothetical protein
MIELRIDGVLHDVRDISVLRSEALPGGLPFTLVLRGDSAKHTALGAGISRSGRPTRTQLESLLSALRRVTEHPSLRFPRFSIATINQVEVADNRLQVVGTCSLIVVDAFPSLRRRRDEEL